MVVEYIFYVMWVMILTVPSLCFSTFPFNLLRSLSEHVVSQSVECVLPNLTHHLKLLSLAMRATDIPPTVSD